MASRSSWSCESDRSLGPGDRRREDGGAPASELQLRDRNARRNVHAERLQRSLVLRTAVLVQRGVSAKIGLRQVAVAEVGLAFLPFIDAQANVFRLRLRMARRDQREARSGGDEKSERGNGLFHDCFL